MYEKYQKFIMRMQQLLRVQQKFREEWRYLLYGFAFMATLYLAGCFFALLTEQSLSEVTPFSMVNLLFSMIKSGNYSVLVKYLFSLGLASLGIVFVKWVYPKFGAQSIRWLVIGGIGLLAWSYISSIAFSLLLFRGTKYISPLFYFQIWLSSAYRQAYSHTLFVSALTGTAVLFFIKLFYTKQSVPNIYGNAHFANAREARESGVFSKSGVLLGKAFNQYLRMGGYEHVTLFAPTGTGKTVALTIPNLLSWEDSIVASDLKLVLYQLTSGYRKSIGQDVFLWNPGSPLGLSHCYNPLDVIENNPYTRVDELQKIAMIFIPDNPKIEPIWQVQSRLLFVALALYIFDTPGIPLNISEIVKLVKSSPDFTQFIQELLETRDDLDLVCRHNFLKFCELYEKTRVSVIVSFLSYFELFDNPLIVAATSRSDFDIRELRKKRISIYIGITNDNLVRLSPLLSVFYQQLGDVLTRKVPGEDEPYGVLCLLDEFSSLRRMETFHKNIGLYREFKIRMMLIIQELSQLYDIYGRDGAKVFINAKVRMAFTQTDEETKGLLESALGCQTLAITNVSRRLGITGSDETVSTQYVRRPLMLKDEIGKLNKDKALILVEGSEPILANKIRWYSDKRFKKLILPPIEIMSLLSGIKSKVSEDATAVKIISLADIEELDNEV